MYHAMLEQSDRLLWTRSFRLVSSLSLPQSTLLLFVLRFLPLDFLTKLTPLSNLLAILDEDKGDDTH